METKFNFKSQIATSREQSEKLLALGLKKETADCYYWQSTEPMYGEASGIWYLETLTQRIAKNILNTLTRISECASLMMKNTILPPLGHCTGYFLCYLMMLQRYIGY